MELEIIAVLILPLLTVYFQGNVTPFIIFIEVSVSVMYALLGINCATLKIVYCLLWISLIISAIE